MFERFTDRARRVLVLAQERARKLNHGFIGTEHILLGLVDEGEGVAAKALQSLEISLHDLEAAVVDMIGRGDASSAAGGSPPFTPRAKKVLELSLREALQLGHNYIGTEHMLLGVLREGRGVGAQALVRLGADLTTVRQRVIDLMSGYGGVSVLPAVDPADVTPAPAPIEPTELLRPEDVEAVLQASAGVGDMLSGSNELAGVTYSVCRFKPKPLPELSISVAQGQVSQAGFDAFAAAHPDRTFEPVEGVGDVATFEKTTGSLRVLVGSALLVVTVHNHPDPLAAATTLGRAAAARVAGA